MDLAKTLIRSVVRTFYDTNHVLVIDALMVHSALPKEDLTLLLGIHPKDLGKLCGALKQDRMLAVHSRLELREGQQRPLNREYYYVDFHATIDAIKYRMMHVTAKVKEMFDPKEEKKEFYCPRCKAQYTALEAMDSMADDMMNFKCQRCGYNLESQKLTDGASTGNAKMEKVSTQLKGFVEMLVQIDAAVIPINDFETAFDHAVPVPRNESINPTRPNASVVMPNGAPAAVKGMRVTAAPIDVTVTTSSEMTAAEQAAEAQRKAAIAEQNVLPLWHTKSTVTGESTVIERKGSDLPQHIYGGPLSQGEEEDQKENVQADDELTAYYAQMAQERENEANKEADTDEEDDEDEEDFEDVGLDASAIGTPSSSMSAEPNGTQKRAPNGSMLRKDSESGSSAPVTNTPTPAASGPGADEEEGPVPKKVKFENQENGIDEVKAEKDSDEDEEAEFEDAL